MENVRDLKELLNVLTKKVDRIDRKLSPKTIKEKETWVKVGTITDLTGWGKENLRAARLNNTIAWKKTTTGFWYLLESLPERLIKRKSII